jgi:hypothetical protein
VDLPQVLVVFDTGRLLAERVEFLAVVGPAVHLDAVGVDGMPAGREQLDVVVGRQGDRDVADGLDHRGVLQ